MLSTGFWQRLLSPPQGPRFLEVLEMSKKSRRSFLRTSSAWAAAWSILGTGRSVFPSEPAFTGVRTEAPPKPADTERGEPSLRFPTEPRARLAVASWPFREFIESPTNRWARNPKKTGMDLKDFGAMVANRFGLRNIEPLGSHFRSREVAYLSELRETTEKAGVHIINIPADLQSSFYDPDTARRHESIAASRKWIEIAVAVGSPSVRLHIAGVHKAKPDVARTADSLKQVAEFGAEKNVLVNLENDDTFTEDPFFIVQVLERVNNPYLHALPDFCNSMLAHDQDFNNRAMEAMFQHAYNISHMKDSEVGDNGKLYTVDAAKCFEIAKAAAYRGYFSMEWEGGGDPYEGVQKLIDLSLKYLA
jgi:sugar phosphate isomerase/epimerase